MIALPLKKLTAYTIVCLLVSMPLLVEAHRVTYSVKKDGVIVHLSPAEAGGTRLLRLQVISDKIIHVIASPDTTFSTAESLMIVSDSDRPAVCWTSGEEGDYLVVKTTYVIARLSLHTGQLRFTDRSGQVLLQEKIMSDSLYKPWTADGKKMYEVSRRFEQQPQEAMYGLGENQSGYMNLAGKPVELTQNNSVAVVPFMVSTARYGILWDNYSISRFGDCREYLPLSALTLYDAEGRTGGLTASYAPSKEATVTAIHRIENNIGYEYLHDLAALPRNYRLFKGRVTWQGAIVSSETGVHKFLCKSAGYTQLYINDSLIVNKWRQAWNPGTTAFELPLVKGIKYAIRLEWIPDGDESFQCLRWLPPVPEPYRNSFAFWSEAGEQADYYFIYGKNADEVVAGYRHLTGKAPVMPKWAMGLWQSRERYTSQEEILGTVAEFRKRNIPLDNIVMDWQYWRPDQWGSHEFDTSRFPDATGMIRALHQQYHTRFMISVWPKFYTGTHNYELFQNKGWLYTKNVENGQKDWIGHVSTFYDAFNPQARRLFWQLMDQHLYSKGVDAWWLDATEPDIYSNISVARRKLLMQPGSLGSPTQYFNAFPIQNAKGVYEGQRRANADDRVFILTRSAYAGIQRYAAAVWSGDIAARWEDMRDQVATGVNFSLSGVPYWSMDIGGFAVERRYEKAAGKDLDEWREQMTRWYQFGAFCPLFRVHGQYPYREIFNVAPEDHPAYQSMLYYDRLRYRLMPYIYTLAGMTWHQDYTIMRGLAMDFAADPNTWDIKDEFMLGPSLLICPVTTYKARSRQVYLPAGSGWYQLYTGDYTKGGITIAADAAYEKMPVFVKQGTILPEGPLLQYATEKAADTITLHVYTGADGGFTLYEDENTNYNYEKGIYSNIPIAYKEQEKRLDIGVREGNFPGMLLQRTFRIKWITPLRPSAFDAATAADAVITYTGKKISLTMK